MSALRTLSMWLTRVLAARGDGPRPRPPDEHRPGARAPSSSRRRGRCGRRRRRAPAPDRRSRRRSRGSASAVEGTESSWRPPWLETITPSTPTSAARLASSGSRIPLTTSCPSQLLRTQAMSSHVTLGSNWASTQSRNSVGLLAPGTAFSRFPNVSGLPPRGTSAIQRGWETRSRLLRSFAHEEAAPTTALRVSRWRAPTTARSIVSTSTGEPTARARDDQVLGVGAVPHHIELEPRRGGGGARDLLDRAYRDGRLDERHAGRLGGAGGLGLRPSREHPRQAHRPEDHRHRQALAEHLAGLLADRDVAHHDLAQQHALQIRHVRSHRELVVGAAVDVVEQLARKPAPRELAIVEHRGGSDAKRSICGESHGVNLTDARGAVHRARVRAAARRMLAPGTMVACVAGSRSVLERARGVRCRCIAALACCAAAAGCRRRPRPRRRCSGSRSTGRATSKRRRRRAARRSRTARPRASTSMSTSPRPTTPRRSRALDGAEHRHGRAP